MALKTQRRSGAARPKPEQSLSRSRRVSASGGLKIPADRDEAEVSLPEGTVKLTHLRKLFWPDEGITKRDLLQYYVDVSPVLLPHLQDRAMVMKRYPNGANGEFFFMKRAPEHRPEELQICPIDYSSGDDIEAPVVRDLLSLLWTINLGCIDLNPWYARCDDIYRPDYLHFDLDPVVGATFNHVQETALAVRNLLKELKIPCYPKTTGSRGIHIYVPIVRGPLQKQVWAFAKNIAKLLESRQPKLITAEYRIAARPKGHVLVDYNQNAWGRTLASVYSVRPKPRAPVSTPLRWEEVEKGVRIEDFRIDNVPARIRKLGDLWKPLLAKQGRVDLDRLLH